MSEKRDNENRDKRVLELYEKVLEIEQRLIPTGLHVFGRVPGDSETADLLRMVASFDRPELGIRSLPELVVEGLGLPSYSILLRESSSSEQKLKERERVEAIVNQAIHIFVSSDTNSEANAAEYLAETASVHSEHSLPVFELLSDIVRHLK